MHLSNHRYDNNGDSSKVGGSHCKVDSFVQEITRRIAEMVARDLRPISIVEGVGFRHLLSYMKPGYHVPSYTY